MAMLSCRLLARNRTSLAFPGCWLVRRLAYEQTQVERLKNPVLKHIEFEIETQSRPTAAS